VHTAATQRVEACLHASCRRSLLSLRLIPRCCSLEPSGFQYLPRGSFFVASRYQQAAIGYVDTFILFQGSFCGCFVLLCCTWMLAYFVPQIYGENRDIRQQRAILLLLPPQLFRSSPALKSLLASIMQNSGSSSSSVGGGADAGASGRETVNSRRL